MKKTILAVALVVFTVTSVFAQEKGIRFGIKGGLNMATISGTDGQVDDESFLPSFNAGVFLDMPLIGKVLSLQPGILYTGKGVKYDIPVLGEVSINPYYVEGQANVLFKIPLESLKIFVGAGPYLACGVNGKGNSKNSLWDEDFDISFTNVDPTTNEPEYEKYGKLNRWDYGLNLTAGLEVSSFVISVGYGHGLGKVMAGVDNDNDSGKHRVLSASVGFLF